MKSTHPTPIASNCLHTSSESATEAFSLALQKMRPKHFDPIDPRHLSAFLLVSAVFFATGCTHQSTTLQPQHGLLQPTVGGRAAAEPLKGGFIMDGPRPHQSVLLDRSRKKLARSASKVVGKSSITVDGKRFRSDCSGTTRAIYASAGFPLGGTALSASENDTSILFRYVKENGSLRRSVPVVGDLVFFDNTYDKNRNGRRDDVLTHIGVIEKILDDGTIVFVHKIGAGILRYRMNLEHPSQRRDKNSGSTLNHYLRRASGGQKAKTTAELFTGFGTVLMDNDDVEKRVAAR
ncbi:MAG: C40 family peptidase [Deltaproteobacteria bacterium]|nr:C40 family peptidase [Deltaproteobacteria bacterium]